jgi:aminoglycoside phosphotransferase (APT) family kinase protein
MSDEPGPLIASGCAADVYDLGDGTVLRRYRTTGHDVELEVRVMRHVAERGYPVPSVHSFDGTDLVMDRIDGQTMLDRLTASPWKVLWHARVLARLQRRLARIAAPTWLIADGVDTARPQSVLHLDLHPMNVIMSPSGPVVLDWTNAAAGPAGFDGALTYVEVRTFETETVVEQIGQRILAESFKSFRGSKVVSAYIGAACDHRLADSNLQPAERAAVAALRRSHV